MTMPIPFFRPPAPEVPAIMRAAGHGDVQWNRRVFKAPPLAVQPPITDIHLLTAEIQNRLCGLR